MTLKPTIFPPLLFAPFCLAALVAAAPAVAQTQASCSALKGCEQKFCEMEIQLNMAKQTGDNNQISGLQMALDNAKTSCSDSRLKDALTAKLAEANQDLVRYQADLQQAEQDGKKDKIVKYKKKLEETTSEINRLNDQLSQLEQLPQ
jgi:chromosome segregation ATPase